MKIPKDSLKKLKTSLKNSNVIDTNGEDVALNPFSLIVDIPYKALFSYTKTDPTKCHKSGKFSDKDPILNNKDRKLLTCVLLRADRGNELMS